MTKKFERVEVKEEGCGLSEICPRCGNGYIVTTVSIAGQSMDVCDLCANEIIDTINERPKRDWSKERTTDTFAVVEMGYYHGLPVDAREFDTLEKAKEYIDFKTNHRRQCEGPAGSFKLFVNGKEVNE